jgi:hypothetical protein
LICLFKQGYRRICEENLGQLMDEIELDRIIREVVSVHTKNYHEHGVNAPSKLAAVKEVIERNIARITDEN